ncbi:MAG TPA: (Fe-S)-binding protein [Dehalococcoidales bacterium]|nr:(Fe-S)-binding protein [Dehalococcoidales bacterium]
MSILTSGYPGISGFILFWFLFAVALTLFVQRVYFNICLIKKGRPENRFDRLFYRLKRALSLILTQSGNLKSLTFKDPAALGHTLMFWGLILFSLAYVIFIGLGAGMGLFSVYNGSTFERVSFSILDLAAFLVIISILWVIIKRYIIRPERLARPQNAEEKITQALLLTVILVLMVLHYLIAGTGYALYAAPGDWPPVGSALAGWFAGSAITLTSLETLFTSLWWVNYLLLLGVLIYAPRSKHLHPLASFFNLAFQSLEPKGSLRPVDLNKPETIGVSRVQDFTWKQLLDLGACTWCGHCHMVCPARLSGKELSPRELVLDLREHLFKSGPALFKNSLSTVSAVPVDGEKGLQTDAAQKPLTGSVISEEAIWSCTTCRACQETCPVSIEHIDKIIDFRRHLQMIQTTETARDVLKNLRVRGNPWRGTINARTDWAEGMGIKIAGEDRNIDVLFWVGCTEALEDRSLKIARAVARLMQEAGVNFGILGEEEMCCGDPARRFGAEHIYQMLALNNIQLLQGYNIKKIVTACPHCYNTLKNEYPQLGGRFEVVHHTQFLAGLIKNEQIRLNGNIRKIVSYQDPCYLGRFNDIFDSPRQILQNIPGIETVEMAQNQNNAFCCGGGGGRMWLEEKTGQRISEMRLKQANETRAEALVTACPFCLQMFEDAARAAEGESILPVMDIAELAAASLETSVKRPETAGSNING